MVHKYYSHTEYKNCPDATETSKVANSVGRLLMFIGSWMFIISLCTIPSEGFVAVIFVALGAALVYLGYQCATKGDERAAKIAREAYNQELINYCLKMEEEQNKR